MDTSRTLSSGPASRRIAEMDIYAATMSMLCMIHCFFLPLLISSFALSIPYLPDPTRHQVTVAYLLFRIADTLEDAASWPKAQRVGALHDFAKLLGDRDPDAIQRLTTEWAAEVPIDHDGYQELMEEIPFVLDAYFELPDAARDIV